jgi:chromosome partitioning protein
MAWFGRQKQAPDSPEASVSSRSSDVSDPSDVSRGTSLEIGNGLSSTDGDAVDGADRDTRETSADERREISVEAESELADTPLARELADMNRRRQAVENSEIPLPPETRVFTISNQKGGVGKTTTVVNLAAAMAKTGARVLVIDLDPQGNASTALGVEHREGTRSIYDVIISDVPMADVVQISTEAPNLLCVPATIDLAGAEIELVSMVAREQRLSRALGKFLETIRERIDYVFIDCPPSLGLLTINAFVAAGEVLIPIQCEYYALEGLSQLLKNIQMIETHLNPKLRVTTILLTMFDSRTNLAHQVADDVRAHFPNEVLQAIIPRSVRISEAPSYGQTVISYDGGSAGSLSYLEAAAEIARRGAR